jgi:hypothetical protein
MSISNGATAPNNGQATAIPKRRQATQPTIQPLSKLTLEQSKETLVNKPETIQPAEAQPENPQTPVLGAAEEKAQREKDYGAMSHAELVELLRQRKANLAGPEWNAFLRQLTKECGKDKAHTAIKEYLNPEQADSEPEIDPNYLYRPVATIDFPNRARPEAFYGVAGKVARELTNGTELFPEAVLCQFLCVMGNMLGRGLYKESEGRHGTLINVAIVGDTGQGGKGGSLYRLKQLIGRLSQTYFQDKFTKGHNSSEALLEEIRDAVFGMDESGNSVVKEAEVKDKRLIIVEEELSRLFIVGNRDGCTMSEFIRDFYDYPEKVKAVSRKSRLMSSKPMVSVMGHITREGLKSSLKTVELFNGLANRFMFCASRRIDDVPEPSKVDYSSDEMKSIVNYLKQLLNTFRPKPDCKDNKEHEFSFSDQGRLRWHEAYRELSRQIAGKMGLHAALLARGKPTVLRLAIIYAALDTETTIQPCHLDAAMALWEFSSSSGLWAFGANSGNTDADKILKYLRRYKEMGAGKSAIRLQVFQNRIVTSDLNEALSHLHNSKLARFEKKGNAEHWWVL